MARCAVCLQPITDRMHVRIADTEALHAACAASGRRTVLADARERIQQLQSELAREQRRNAEQGIELRELERRLKGIEAKLPAIHQDLKEASEGWAEEVARAERLARQLAKAQQDLAKRAGPPRTEPVRSDDHSEDNTKDPTEQRFSLLELD